MAIDDLSTLKAQLPEVFSDIHVPDGWDDEWYIVPIDQPEQSALLDTLVPARPDFEREVLDLSNLGQSTTPNPSLRGSSDLPDFGSFPGAPSRRREDRYPQPPPDAFAFYLPFHYFYPNWWGVYLVLERTLTLADFIQSRSRGCLTMEESLAATRIFLYAHEAFHHNVECFATRLEIAHRKTLYREGFARLYRRLYDSDDCLEEALATAHGLRRVEEKAFPGNKDKTARALAALTAFVDDCPPGYRRAAEFMRKVKFDNARFLFAEQNYQESSLGRAKEPAIWSTFPHAFSGISRVTSRVNYLVRRNSDLASRLNLNLRYLRYRDLVEKLKLKGCEKVREGKGGHEIWQSPLGKTFPVPRHPGDLRQGTLAKIIKEAGFNMSLSEFTGSRA